MQGIDRFINQVAVTNPADGNCARSTIPLATPFLGADGAFAQPEIVEQSFAGTRRNDLDKFSGPHEANAIAHLHDLQPAIIHASGRACRQHRNGRVTAQHGTKSTDRMAMTALGNTDRKLPHRRFLKRIRSAAH